MTSSSTRNCGTVANSSARTHLCKRRQRPTSWLLAAAAILAVSSVSRNAGAGNSVGVSALQPALNKANTRNIKSTSASSTALEYVATPETETESSSQDQQQLRKLEQLLRLEFSLEKTNSKNGASNHNQLGWTVISATLPKHPRALRTVVKKTKKKLQRKEPKKLQVKQKKQTSIQVVNQPAASTAAKPKKRVTLAQTARRKVPIRTASPTSTSKSAFTTTPSRLSSKAIQVPRRSATNPTTTLQNKRPSKESVYWLRTPPSSKDASTTKTPLLTRQEEITLTQQIRALREAEHVRDTHLALQQQQQPHHTESSSSNDDDWTESQWATACGFANPLELRRVLRRGQEAQARLVEANMGLVTNLAKRHYASLKYALEAGGGVGTILTLQDCLQDGHIGLMAAAERFDAGRNVRFSTYATWWIRQRILRGISDSSRIIRLPAYGTKRQQENSVVASCCFAFIYFCCCTNQLLSPPFFLILQSTRC